MELSISSISQQLDAIVASQASSAPKANDSTPTVQSSELSALESARASGQEKQYLEEQVAAVNEMVRSVEAPVNFSVEISDSTGYYFVRVLDESGKEVKTIPSDTFVQTRERIHAEVKGLIEDSKS